MFEKVVKPFIVNDRRDSCDCNQGADLKPTGSSPEQGPIKYCPCCKVGFWEHLIQPTPQQINLAQKVDHRLRIDTMEYLVLKRQPKDLSSQWGGGPSAEAIMIDQLGTSPTWMANESRQYWRDKYCKKYPESTIAKAVKKRLEKDY